MNGLTEFLLARIAEDEEVAQTAIGAGADPASRAPIWTSLRSGKPGVCDHGARGSVEMQPARVLAECDAKTEIVKNATNMHTSGPDWDEACRILALPYADHPDYQESWRP